MTKEKILAKVLEFRGFTTDQLEGEVRKAREKLNREQEKLEDFETAHRKTCGEFTERQMGESLRANEMELYYTYLKHLVKEIEQQKKIVQIRRSEVEDRQQALMEAYKEQRLVGKLHEKIVVQENRHASQAEQKEMDYAFISRKAGQ